MMGVHMASSLYMRAVCLCMYMCMVQEGKQQERCALGATPEHPVQENTAAVIWGLWEQLPAMAETRGFCWKLQRPKLKANGCYRGTWGQLIAISAV